MGVNISEAELDEILDRGRYDGNGDLMTVESTDDDAVNVTTQ